MNVKVDKRQILDRWAQPIPRSSPFQETGVAGFAVYGGWIAQKEKSSRLVGTERYRTASDILSNISIVAAGVRYFLNLLARPEWKVDGDDDDESKESAEWLEEIMNDMETPWARMIRRSGMYRFHGFGIQEWVAKKRDDGKIGIKDIESRPQHTIQRWQVDDKGTVTGVWQTSPQTGQEIGLSRNKIIYLLDDTLTDSPEGMGWFRHLVDPAERLKVYLQLEGYGFQRDLNGTPIGRAPLSQINKMVQQKKITQAQADTLIDGMRSFVQMQAKSPDTGMVIDSQPFESMTADGFSVSAVPQWGLELLQQTAGALPQMGEAISRLTYDMARIIGVEGLLAGSEGEGSLALSKDKSKNIYLTVNSTLHDMAAQFSKDLLDPLWALNGLPAEKKPRFTTEDVSFKDVEQISAVLRDMATAGAVLQPDDPAIDDVRDLMGISRAPEIAPELRGMMQRQAAGLPPDPNELDPETGQPVGGPFDPVTGKPGKGPKMIRADSVPPKKVEKRVKRRKQVDD